MSKFQYTHFGDEVPREVEKEYNRMGRREHYLEEQDAAHDVMYLDHKDISRIPDYPADELSPADLLREARLCYLPVTMRKNKTKDMYRMMFPNYPDVVTVKEVSEMLHLSTKKVYQLVKAKDCFCKYHCKSAGRSGDQVRSQ